MLADAFLGIVGEADEEALERRVFEQRPMKSSLTAAMAS